MARRAGRVGIEWETPEEHLKWKHVAIEVLMDIREQLRHLNATMDCHNTRSIPSTLKRIDRRIASAMPLRKGKR